MANYVEVSNFRTTKNQEEGSYIKYYIRNKNILQNLVKI